MSKPSSPRRRRWLRWLLLFGAFGLVACGVLGWYVTTDSFQQYVRRRLVSSLEQATGGRVELGEFHTTPFRLRVDARNLTIHGREAPDQVPYFRVDRLQAEMEIISLLSTQVGLYSLELEHPVVHIIVYPDGSTNQPQPKVKPQASAEQPPVERLFSVSASHVTVRQGQLLWQEKRIPLDFDANDVALTMNYSLLWQHYEAALTLGSVTTRIQNYPPLTWHMSTSLVLARDHADVSALTVATAKSEVRFSGHVQDFQHLQVAGDYRAVVDLGEWGVFFQRRDVRQGTATVAGKGTWRVEDFAASGVLQVKDFDWLIHGVRAQNVRVNLAYSITPQRLNLSAIKLEFFGGRLTGDVDVTNWQTSLEPAHPAHRVVGKIPPGSLQRGFVHLQLAGFPLAPALEVVSSKSLPLNRLSLGGALSGQVEMLWVGSIVDAQTRMDLTIAPPPQAPPGLSPVRGQIRGTYVGSRDELQLEHLQLNTPASEISAAGDLSLASPLHFAVTSHNMAEWGPFLRAASGQDQLPFVVHGWVNVSGNATGKLSAFQVVGNIEMYDFDARSPGHAERLPRAIHWDSLTAAFQYSNSNVSVHNGALIHGHTVVHFEGSTALVGGVPAENSPFNAQFEIRNADVAQIQELVGYDEPLSGTVNLTAHASGTRANPHGEGRLEVRDAMAYGTRIPLLRGDLRLADEELQLNNIESSVFDAPITGSAAISTSSDSFRVNLAGRGVNLARFPKLASSRITIDGLADFAVQASGSRAEPLIEAHVHLRDLAFDKERAGDFYLDAVPRGRELEIQGHSEFEKAGLKIAGTVGLQKGFPADLNLTFRQLDIDSLLKFYLPGKITSHAIAGGSVTLRGPLRSPRDLTLLANVESFEGELEHVQVRNVEPIRVEIADHTVRLEDFHLAGSGTDFTAHGSAQLTGTRAMDFHLDGTVNMALLQSLNPKITARGMLALNLNANGTLPAPLLQGRLELKDAAVSHSEFPSGLSDLNGVLRFDQNRIRIESLNGHTGGGDVSLTGSGTLHNGVVTMDIIARAQQVRLRYPPGVSSTANANLHLTGSTNSALLSGDIVITKLAVTPGFDFGSYLEKSKQATLVAQNETLSSRLKLDIHVTTTPELQMQTALAKLSGNADLRLRGTVDHPVVTGRAEVLEGEVFFNGTKYRLERGDISFPNPARTTAIVDFQAATRVRDYDITVNLSGDVSKSNGLTAKWRSEPPLPEADVIALLALGRTREESAALASSGSSALSGEASNLLISQALNNATASRVQRLFGVSRIKIDPQGLASTTNLVRGPQVTIEQQVASNLTITYSTNVSVASQQIIQVEYNVTRNVSVVALRDQNGVVSFDVKIRQRKR